MILYFNKNGQLLEKLEYGAAPRVGVTNFQIFAYFEGLEDYSIATIRFRRPDLYGSEYPDLFMLKHELTYNPYIERSRCFKAQNNPYVGFIFDFNDVVDGLDHVKLLDTPGMWEASMTLYPSEMVNAGTNVMGLVEFNVEKAVSASDDEAGEAGINVIINNIRQLISQITAGVDTSGATNTTDKIYLIGAKEQATAIKTYSNESLYYEDGTLTLGGDNSKLQVYDSHHLATYKATKITVKTFTDSDSPTNAVFNYPEVEEGIYTIATQEWTEDNVNDMINTASESDINNLFN